MQRSSLPWVAQNDQGTSNQQLRLQLLHVSQGIWLCRHVKDLGLH